MCRVLLQEILDPFVINLQVGNLGPVGGTLLLTRTHPVKHRLTNPWNQSSKFK